MPLSAELQAVVVDPRDRQSLYYFADEMSLYNPRSKQRYSIRNERIPVLLPDEAEDVNETEHSRLMSKAKNENLVPTGPQSGQ